MRWLDKQTRSLEIKFTFHNGNFHGLNVCFLCVYAYVCVHARVQVCFRKSIISIRSKRPVPALCRYVHTCIHTYIHTICRFAFAKVSFQFDQGGQFLHYTNTYIHTYIQYAGLLSQKYHSNLIKAASSCVMCPTVRLYLESFQAAQQYKLPQSRWNRI